MLALVSGCAGTPPPDWQMNVHGALQRAVEAQLSGHTRVAEAEMRVVRSEIARTGRPALLARAELLRCAAEAAALNFGACPAFEPLRADAEAPELAYAAYLAGRASGGADAAQRALLPAAQQAIAAAATVDAARLNTIADPLARLLGAAMALRDNRLAPEAIALAIATASAQGWRRPLLAWLQLAQQRAQQAGDGEQAARLQRRMDLVLGGADGR
ncbi:hypothetical protein [Aquabacterium sp. OR-4]|uniref:hypothetical protein n=1 Tax=Aquabacterium sp. OR-4 TaxID=2978127 RepID=UPI0021B25E81|nr:hypothetical protein [Aquabacterium sp. OR-4]MDT7838313.1 hypothetical protein [Aquabacterium sp. OR-4]